MRILLCVRSLYLYISLALSFRWNQGLFELWLPVWVWRFFIMQTIRGCDWMHFAALKFARWLDYSHAYASRVLCTVEYQGKFRVHLILISDKVIRSSFFSANISAVFDWDSTGCTEIWITRWLRLWDRQLNFTGVRKFSFIIIEMDSVSSFDSFITYNEERNIYITIECSR